MLLDASIAKLCYYAFTSIYVHYYAFTSIYVTIVVKNNQFVIFFCNKLRKKSNIKKIQKYSYDIKKKIKRLHKINR